MNLGELRIPYQYSIPSVLVECAFHDNPKEAEFLIHNQKRIAETIGHALVSFYQLKREWFDTEPHCCIHFGIWQCGF